MPRPHAQIAALRRILQQELAVSKNLVALAEAVGEALVVGDAVRLAELEQEQRRLLEQQEAQERMRQSITSELAWALGMPRVPTLSLLLPALPPAEARAFQILRQQILEAQTQLETYNARNRRLLENALEYVRFSLDLLTSAALKPARYGTNLTQIAVPSFYIDSKA